MLLLQEGSRCGGETFRFAFRLLAHDLSNPERGEGDKGKEHEEID